MPCYNKDRVGAATHLDPNCSHVAGEGGEIRVRGEPVGEGHHDIECGKPKHDVEEGP